jgi:hypothetical protein
MERRMRWTCFLVACLLLVWLSPVGYADPGPTGKDSRININKASVEELEQLPRVGHRQWRIESSTIERRTVHSRRWKI